MSLPIQIRKTFREAWPDSLRELAIPAGSIELSRSEVELLGRWQPRLRTIIPEAGPDSWRTAESQLRQRIQAAIDESGSSVFPRIGYCSWKRSIKNMLPCRDANEVMATIATPDDRIERGLLTAYQSCEPVWLHLVQWRDMQLYQEIRAFVEKRSVVGACTYHEPVDRPIERSRAIWIRKLMTTFLNHLVSRLHLDSVVVDLVIGAEGTIEVLELNPFSELTDAARFRWREGFDQTIRFANLKLDLLP
ncbi:MAG: hypothetical protein AAFN77_07450 [Planctomycetota bacterium]